MARNAELVASSPLYAAYDAAVSAFEQDRSQANYDAVKAAWAAYDAAGPKRKVRAYASRAGKRQYTERRASCALRPR